MDLRPCETCGECGFAGASSVVPVDGELCTRYTAPCRRCGTPRGFTFRLPEEVHLPLGPDVSFGGPEPSELLDPGEWLMAADLAAAGAPEADAADLSMAAAALDEVLKFIPAGADAVPPEALRTAEGREVYEREPGRFRRARLAAVAATYREAAGRMRAPDEAGSPGSGLLDAVLVSEIRRLWGDELVPIPAAVVERADLSPATAALLREVGLPASWPFEGGEFEFLHDERLLSNVSINGVTYAWVASDAGVGVVGLRAGTDEVWDAIGDPVARPDLVNSTLADFLLFMGLLWARIGDIYRDREAAAEQLRREFVEHDARAMDLDEDGGWWDAMLEQAVDGYL